MNKIEQLQWPLIMGMGALALVRPFLSIVGWMDGLGRPAGPLLVSGLISLAWLAIAVFGRVRQPVLTLMGAGVAYGFFAILISAILAPVHMGAWAGPVTNPFATLAVLLTNAFWGALTGSLALLLQKLLGFGATPSISE
ncbi:MAG: hypothetical protein KJZ93_01820 [Caldilineaceae bacterium]|nr:hypothetical protein [Caldilineaceae bacterium]